MENARFTNVVSLGISISIALHSGLAVAQSNARPIDADKARIVDYWTPERKAKAIPRDLVIDPRGLGYLRRPDGTLVPHGHDIPAQTAPTNQSVSPFGRAGAGSGDTTPPTISGMDPAGSTVGSPYLFKATVTDVSGVKSVTFRIQRVGSTLVDSYSAVNVSGTNDWTASIGLADGNWSWWVVAKDGAAKGGNTATSSAVAFTVSTGSSGGGGNTVMNDRWTSGGDVKKASGRLYFEMPGNAKRKVWWGYVCSGTVAIDPQNKPPKDVNTQSRSVIITAAHCVYDDVNKAYARNVMFIPDQDGTTGSGTDRNCSNDPIGCWVPSFGVVDVNWTTRTFPANIAWDYAYYVVKDSGAHQQGLTSASDVLDDAAAAGSLPISFSAPAFDVAGSSDYTHALGYSYNQDPNFMYCAQDMTTEGNVNWWLSSCGMSGGSSGGPWVQPLSGGTGPIISVNSWGYTSSPGMAGPILDRIKTTAQCVYEKAIDHKLLLFPAPEPIDGDAGFAVCGQ